MNKLAKNYSLRQKLILALFTLDIISWYIAAFSNYHPVNIEFFLDIACFLILLFGGGDMILKKNISLASRYFVSCMAIIFIPVFFYSEIPFATVISRLFFAVAFILLKAEFKWAVNKIFIKIFSVIVILGLCEYILLLFGRNFFWDVVERNTMSQVFNHGIFILVPTNYTLFSYRFMSLCEEPGIFSTICFFILITIDYKKQRWLFFLMLFAGLISFSLGFYVLIILWALTQFGKVGVSQTVISAIAIFAMLFLFGDFFKDEVLERVSGKNIETVDNRTNYEVDRKLNEIIQNGQIYYGMGNRQFYDWQSRVAGISAGVKNFVLQYGVVGLLILVISYSWLILRIRGKSKATLIVIAFVWISFYKSNTWNYPPLLVSVLSIPLLIEKKIEKERSIGKDKFMVNSRI